MASILVIDDSATVRVLFRVALEGQGHEVREAPDGAAGLAAYRQRPADLVLCDLFMPNKDGLETIRELRGGFPGSKVIAVSGGSCLMPEADFLPLARGLGAVAVLDKPVSPAALTEAVERALRATPGRTEVAL